MYLLMLSSVSLDTCFISQNYEWKTLHERIRYLWFLVTFPVTEKLFAHTD